MTYSQRALLKQLLFLTVVLLAILLSIVLFRHHRNTQAESSDAPAGDAADSVAQPQGYTQLTYSNGSATLSFSQDETGTWVWTDDPGFPLDDTTVRQIVQQLNDLTPQQTITNGDTLEAYGLDTPSATLTATDPTDGKTTTLTFGNATVSGDSRYLLMDDDKNTVYIVADTLYDALSTPIFSMCRLPEFPELTEKNIRSIVIDGTVTTTLTAIQPEDSDSSVTWDADGTDVTDSDTLLDLLGELKTLSFSQCIDYQPAQEASALCGFDAPTLILSIDYLSDTGTEETLLLTVGGITMDQTGFCARLDADTTIYQLDRDTVSALLQVAQSGLSAS